MNDVSYERRLVAFIDILGFKAMVKATENNPTEFNKLYNAISEIKSWESYDSSHNYLYEIEEDAQKKGFEKYRLEDSINATAFSDSIVISVKVNNNDINEKFSSLVCTLAHKGNNLLKQGILLRGGISIGNLLHMPDGTIVGQGLIDAYNLESSLAKYPRFILSNKLIKELNYPLDSKRNRHPYHQYIERFEDGCVGFHQIKYNQVMNSLYDYTQEAQLSDLKLIRDVIVKGLDFSFEHPNVVEKYQWLKKQYNKLIIFGEGGPEILEKIQEFSNLNTPFNIHYTNTEFWYTQNEWTRK